MENKNFKLEGANEVVRAMQELPAELQVKFLKGFIRKAGKKFIVDPLKAILPYFQDTVKVVSKSNLAIAAGVSSKGYKLRWIEFGTVERKTKKGYNRGKMNAKNQIKPFIDSQVEPIVEYSSKEMGNEINKMLERKLKRIRKIK